MKLLTLSDMQVKVRNDLYSGNITTLYAYGKQKLLRLENSHAFLCRVINVAQI